ncbi:MAG: hypothetical protein HOV94_08055 [Saccharothrix sp.]|nr:hypothetical protein [Saccharothrix sp.]
MTTAATPSARKWIPVVAWTPVVLGLFCLLAVVASPVVALVAAAASAFVALACRALLRARHKLDRILAEELDR